MSKVKSDQKSETEPDLKGWTRRQLLKIGAGAGAMTLISAKDSLSKARKDAAGDSISATTSGLGRNLADDKDEDTMQPMIDRTEEPRGPLAAATHPNPYPYYARLVAEKPIYWDSEINLWVASSAEAVRAVMTSSICHVRPVGDPVPKHILGSPAGDIFRQLVRQNDGARHTELRELTDEALNRIRSAFGERSQHWAGKLSESVHPASSSKGLNDFVFGMSVYVIADLLNVPEDLVPNVCLWANQLSRCFSPLSTPEQIEEGKAAAAHLIEVFKARRGESAKSGAHIVGASDQHAASADAADRVSPEIANQIGFFTQSYEGTAALIGTTLLVLASNSELRSEVSARPEVLDAALDEVLRYDSPVQNTRRFVSGGGRIAGKEMKEGDSILVVLAAANRDPLLNPDSQAFKVQRENRQMFAFGMGSHGCMGPESAKAIAKAGIIQLLQAGIDPKKVAQSFTYRRSLNVRVPVFGSGESVYS